MSSLTPPPRSDGGFEVRHNTAASRFEVELQGQLSICAYFRQAGLLTLNHTVVPPELGGRGIAAAMVSTALAWARSEGLKVVPQCSFVAMYMKRHADTHDLLAS
jgi:predicted GNAT family acetyltransferase